MSGNQFDPSSRGHVAFTRNRVRVTLLGVACIAFGLLIWSRLLLVTSYPKTAIAEPPANKAPAGPQTAAASSARDAD